MTATIKPSGRRSAGPSRRIRFSSLETLGFTDVAHVWTDTPMPEPDSPRGRHVAPPPKAETVADWQPEEFGARLHGSNVRWSVIAALVLVVGAVAVFGYWLYQRPATLQHTAEADLTTQAQALETALPALTEFSQGLLVVESVDSPGGLDAVEGVARALFNTSGSVTEIDLRSAASQAAGSTLDGIRLVQEAHAYRSGVLPMLVTPPLETDPELIALDEAARAFGSWQLAFDDVRTALPDGAFTEVTTQLDVLSGDLTAFLGRYLDALRQDDQGAVESVLAALGSRLAAIESDLIVSIEDIQARVGARVDETLTALQSLPG